MARAFTAVVLLAALGLWVPLAMTTTPWPPRFVVWPFQLALGVVALVVLARTRPDLERVHAPGLRAGALRAFLGAVVAGVGTWVHILCGGGAVWVKHGLFIEAGAVLGLLLGPLAIFEHHAAGSTTRRSALLAAALTGWAATLALALGWLQAHYFDEIVSGKGSKSALEAVRGTSWWLVVDPPWTLRHFGWVSVPLAALVWGRLRGFSVSRQVALALGGTGALWSVFPGDIPVVTFGLGYLAVALPIAFAVVDVLDRRLARRAPPSEAEPDDRMVRGAWVFAVVLCILAALGALCREGYRALRRSELRVEVPLRMTRWRGRVVTGTFRALEEEYAAIKAEYRHLHDGAPTVIELEALQGRLLALGERIRDLRRARLPAASDVAAISSLLVEIEENGGGPDPPLVAELSELRAVGGKNETEELEKLVSALRIMVRKWTREVAAEVAPVSSR